MIDNLNLTHLFKMSFFIGIERRREYEMKHLGKVLVTALLLTVVLAGCGRSVEKDLLGSWKLTQEGEENRYLEFSEEQLVLKESSDEKEEVVAYKVKDMKKDRFSIEIAEKGTDTYTFFIEGIFENDERIKVTKLMEAGDKTASLVKVKDIDKEIKKDQKAQEQLAAKEEQKRADEEAEAEKERLKEEAEQEEQQAVEQEETIEKEEPTKKETVEKVEKPSGTTEENTATEETETEVEENQPVIEEPVAEQGLQDQYLMKVDLLREKMISDAIAEQPDAEDTWPGFSARYAGQWDALLNEVLGLLQETMPANEYEALNANQVQWVQEKEVNYAKYQSGDVPTGWTAEDLIAEETSARVIHLISSYLQ